MTANLPAQIGPCRFGALGNWITVRCPRDFDPLCAGRVDSGSRAPVDG